MSLLVLGLVLQAAALIVVLRGRSKQWLSYSGVLFVCMAVVFHGLTEIVQLIFPGMNPYRLLIDETHVYDFVPVVSLGIFLFAVTYALVSASLTTTGAARTEPAVSSVSVDWKIVMLLVAPAFVLSVSGVQLDQLGYWLGGLIGEFVLFGIILCSLLLALKRPQLVVVILLIQALMIGLLGQRLQVLVATVIVLAGLSRHRIKVKLGQMVGAVVVVALIAVTISATRATFGRDNLKTDVLTRFSGFMTGASSLVGKGSIADAILGDIVYRFDGNSFGAIINSRINQGHSTPGLAAIEPNLALVVPRFLNAQKLERGEVTTEEEVYMGLHYDMPIEIDYLPTTLGILFAYYGSLGLLVACILLGVMFALTDDWLMRKRTLFSFIVSIGLIYCVMFMEQGLRVYFVTFRSIAVLYGVLLTLQLAHMVNRTILLGSVRTHNGSHSKPG